MIVPIVLAVASAGCFLGLAHAAVTTPRALFVRLTFAMSVVALTLMLLSPAAGAALLGPVLLSRLLVNRTVPQTVTELLDRYPAARMRNE